MEEVQPPAEALEDHVTFRVELRLFSSGKPLPPPAQGLPAGQLEA